MKLTYSDVESRRFGLRVSRAEMGEINENAILEAMSDDELDIAFIRIPAAQQASISRLDRVGLPYLVADTLVEYSIDLTTHEPTPLRNHDLVFREATSADQQLLADLVAEIFPEYTNHYHSNPLLNKQDILAGYQEWATGYIGTDTTTAFLAYRRDLPVGFATCRWTESRAEGVLYGVRPDAAGGGIYGDLIRYTQSEFKRRGKPEMRVSTQVQNLPVQKAWVRSGFVLDKTMVTVHVNALFGTTQLDPVVVDVPIERKTTEMYAKLTGDRNPLHFDGDYAAARGFEAEFAHGLVANGVLSQVLGMLTPGAGTVFMGYRYRFFGPLYFDRVYRFEVRYPVANPSGFHIALARVFDDQNHLRLIAYCDLFVPHERPSSRTETGQDELN